MGRGHVDDSDNRVMACWLEAVDGDAEAKQPTGTSGLPYDRDMTSRSIRSYVTCSVQLTLMWPSRD